MSISLLFGGDLMMGRLVKKAMLKYGVDYPLKNIVPLFKSSDINIVNLECAITSSSMKWSGTPKAFYFGASPNAAKALETSHIDVVSLANNHLLDFDYQGLKDTLLLLDKYNIKHTGAGENIFSAKEPAFFEYQNIKFAMVAYCDHQADFSADKKTPGINFLNLRNVSHAIDIIEKDFAIMADKKVDWPILSFHWGENMVLEPTQSMIEVAHAAIDIGYKIIFGHSAHVFHGVEFYKNYPIIYAAGDLVDDYAVDPYLRNDLGLLFKLIIDNDQVNKIILHPLYLDFCKTLPADNEQTQFIEKRMQKLCSAFNTKLEHDDLDQLTISP